MNGDEIERRDDLGDVVQRLWQAWAVRLVRAELANVPGGDEQALVERAGGHAVRPEAAIVERHVVEEVLEAEQLPDGAFLFGRRESKEIAVRGHEGRALYRECRYAATPTVSEAVKPAVASPETVASCSETPSLKTLSLDRLERARVVSWSRCGPRPPKSDHS